MRSSIQYHTPKGVCYVNVPYHRYALLITSKHKTGLRKYRTTFAEHPTMRQAENHSTHDNTVCARPIEEGNKQPRSHRLDTVAPMSCWYPRLLLRGDAGAHRIPRGSNI